MTGPIITRRAALTGAVAAAISPARAQPSILVGKIIPSTNERLPAIGMGTWRTFNVGENETARAQRTHVLARFFEMGGRLIDSSPMYGSSQSVVGDALARLGRTGDVFAADKVWVSGGDNRPGKDNGPGQIAQTQERWGVDGFDLLQVHNLVSWRAHLETLFAMKADGRLRHVGVTSYSGLRYDDIAQIMTSHPIDFIQITYNIADREAERRLLPLAAERNIAVIANRPFREGALIGRVNRLPLPAMAAEIGAENWAQFLLKFIISHRAITAAIPATRRVDHMTENMGALRGPMPDAAQRRAMAAAFERL